MEIEKTPNLNILWASLMIEELVRNGITDFFIAPGFRSAPLTIAAGLNKKTKTYVHFDERGLAFFALGKISATKKPAVIISTSGTAVANFLPAIIETSKKKLPLIILTADRPPELLNTGASQTIDQKHIFGKYVRWEFDMPVPDINISPEMVLTTMDQAVSMARQPEPGPVHINCAYREPLSLKYIAFEKEEYLETVDQWLKSNEPYTKYYKSVSQTDMTSNVEIINLLNNKKGIIVVGKLATEAQQKSVMAIADKLNWPIFPDITSGLRVGVKGKNIIHYFDRILGSKKFNSEKIETILHLGGRITAKSYYEYIKRIKPENYITVLNHYLRNDPLHCVNHRVKSEISSFINAILPSLKPQSDRYIDYLKNYSEKINNLYSDIKNDNRISEVSLARIISQLITKDNGLFLSNSMPIRDMDTFADRDGAIVSIGGNRGASGIDGIIATSCGFAEGLDKPVTAIIGDLAFLHDMNSLALLRSTKNQMIFIVINNQGGGIFSFLPVKNDSEIFEEYFETPHDFSFKNTAEMFGLIYHNPKSNKDLIEVYKESQKNKNHIIIEVNTNREENYLLHKKIVDQINNL